MARISMAKIIWHSVAANLFLGKETLIPSSMVFPKPLT